MQTNNEGLVKSFFDAVNNHDVKKMSSIVADDYINEWVGMGPGLNKSDWIKTICSFLESFPDYKDTITNLYTTSTGVIVIEFTGSGTHKKDWLGIPPTYKRIEWKFIALIEIENGKFKRLREYVDTAAFFKQTKLINASFF
jgi:steroid delta-isomerase-like uncharacterized protein